MCILSDSICKHIKLPEFNKQLNNKKAYKRCFDGGDTKALLHFALYVLENDKPDIVIINVGSNNMRKDKPVTVAEDIITLVDLCKKQGVGQTFVSAVTRDTDFKQR